MNRVIIFVLLALSGCGGYSIRNIDKPAPALSEGWIKAGATQLDVKKALLECGAPHPDANDFIYEKALGIKDFDEQMSHFLLTKACMERAGYADRWRSLAQSCADSNFPKRKTYPACQPGAAIPERSVERRLNSWHCKLKTDRDYCRKYAFVPSACDDPKKDYNNPPPECRP
jgi:hypothetical protein